MKERIINLKNGGKLIYSKSNLNDCSAFEVGFLAGSYCDNKRGVAHFLEHTLFKKTTKRDNQKIENDRNEIVFLNAVTSSDYLVLNFFRSNKLIEKSMEFAEDVLINSVIDDEFMQSEKSVISEELNICKDNESRNIYAINLRQAQSKVMFSSDIVGKNEKNIAKIKFQDLVDFKNKYFYGNNFIISVTTNLSIKKIKKITDKYFVKNIKFNPKFIPKTTHFNNTFIDKNSSIKIISNDEEKVAVLVSFKISKNEIDLMQNLSYSFLSKYFSGLQGDLFLKLRNKGLIYRLNSDFVCFYKDSLFNINFETSEEKIKQIIEILNEEIVSLLNNGIENCYVNSYKNNYEYYGDEKMPTKMKQECHNNLIDFICFGKILNYTKKQKNKMIKYLSIETITQATREIFKKNNKIFVTVMGNISKHYVPTLEYFKTKFLITEE